MTVPGNLSSPLLATAADAAAAAAGPIKSLRFNSGDSAYLSKTFSSAGNRKTFTFSCWVKKAVLGVSQVLLDQRGGSPQSDSNLGVFYLKSDNTLEFSGGVNIFRQTTRVLRDLSAWYHVVLACDTTSATADDRVKVYVNGVQETNFANSATISQNFEFSINQAALHGIGASSLASPSAFLDGYLADIYFIDGSQLDPTSFGAYDDNGVWQAAAYSGTFGTNGFHLLDFANESTVGHDSSGNDNDFTANNLVAGVGKVFTTAKIYSVYASATVSSNYSVQYSDDNSNWTTAFSGVISNNGAFGLQSGTNPGDGSYGLRKYWRYVTGSVVSTHHPRCSRIVLSDGVSDVNIQVFTSDNTSDSGTIPAEGDTYTYTDTTAAADIDVLFDVPTNGTQSDTGAGGEVSGCYATLNPLAISPNSTPTLSNGNLEIERTATASEWTNCGSTVAVSTGKWYWEIQFTTINGTIARWGVADVDDYEFNRSTSGTGLPWLGSSTGTSWSMDVGGNTLHNGSTVNSSYTSTVVVGDVIGVALDCDANTLTFYKNGASLGTAHSNVTASRLVPAVSLHGATHNKLVFNFGQRAFAYSAPSGYKALCTTNLPTPTIADGSDYFDTVLYTGNGGTQSITGYSFSPDFLWIKDRTSAFSHRTCNSVTGSTRVLFTDQTNAEQVNEYGTVDQFTSNGFDLRLGSNSSPDGSNKNGDAHVAWAWDAGSSTVSNTDGSITSSVRANASAGFSIVSYTGSGSAATVGHGLNATPSLVICKDRSAADAWLVWFEGFSANEYLYLNTTAAKGSYSGTWGSTPTSSVFGVSDQANNQSGNNFIAYCFAPVAGYSAFGSYDGNGSSDGPFIYTGFRPRWLMVKKTTEAKDWVVWDTSRSSYNLATDALRLNLSNAELNGFDIDVLSNGFKLRDAESTLNTSGTYIYAAFAENPFQANGGLAR